MMELTPDKEEQIQNLGKPLELKPHISDFKFICDNCIDAGLESNVHLIWEPTPIPWRKPYWEKRTGEYRAGFIKWFFWVRCDNDHEHTITKDVTIAYDVDGLINEEEEDSAGEGEYSSRAEAEADRLHDDMERNGEGVRPPKHHDIRLMERVPVGDGGKKDPKETWDAEVK